MINIQMEESICCVVSYLLFLNDVSLILLVFVIPAPGLAVGAVPGYHSEGVVGQTVKKRPLGIRIEHRTKDKLPSLIVVQR